ncbi:sugar-binding transcriptional regulator [Alicyclobacillus sp. ALC3]|uniref:sugar-binding transcriptional regulator n=1 Tax=Alicyclobacillus sp. ALC3 TaxID=2796143 RepID=UPI00237873FD|nr:sugar-binding transcriptional regulator [Alicyclobacillus sp. ALC3]
MNKISGQDEELLVRVAWEYYINQSSQAELAEKMGISRPTVSRLIKRARESGIVNISINSDFGPCIELEERLKSKFNIKYAAIVPTGKLSSVDVYGALGHAAARYVNSNLKRLRSIAVGWGRTIASIPSHARIDPGVTEHSLTEVVEMIGNFTSTGKSLHSLRLSLNLAQAYGATASVLSAPALTVDAATCETLKSHTQIKSVFDKARQADLAIASLGTVDKSSTLFRLGLLNDDEFEELVHLGAVGEVLGRFFDGSGRAIPTSLDDRLVGLTLEELVRIPAVMIVASGGQKVRPIRAALEGGIITHLVTDENTAIGVLET